MSGDDHLARLLAARSALASAEERTGLRPARAPLAPGGRGGPGGALGDPQPGPWLGVGAATSGAVALTGSTSALLALLAHRQGPQGWCAVVGGEDLGWCAAAHLGLALDRVLAVPTGSDGTSLGNSPGASAQSGAEEGPGPRAAQRRLAPASILAVTAALLDGVDALLITAGPAFRLRPRDRATLTARARDRGALILSPIPWEGARLLRAEPRGALVPLRAAAQGAQEMPTGYLDSLAWRLHDDARGTSLDLRLGGSGMELTGLTAPTLLAARRGSA